MILKIKLAWKQIYKLFFAIVGLAILGWAFINGIIVLLLRPIYLAIFDILRVLFFLKNIRF